MEENKMQFKTNPKNRLLKTAYTAMFTAIIIICAQIMIPFGQVPFTLQTLGVFVSAALLGWKRGTLSVLVYIFAGLVGLPVFTGFNGGAGVLFGPTGGYIIGFVFTALIVGIMTERLGKKLWVLVVSMVLGMAVCYAFGTVWFMIITGTGFAAALMLCVVPYLIADALKIAIAAVLCNRLGKIIRL